MNVKLKQESLSHAHYGTINFNNKGTPNTHLLPTNAFETEAQSPNKPSQSSSCFSGMFGWIKCDAAHCHMHCAAISGALPEYGNTVGDSLIVPYLLELGAPVWMTSYVWIITPFIDSWMQPIYGKLSDKYSAIPNACCRLGGRKPFIILFGLFATVGLIVIPQARHIKAAGHILIAVIVCILSYTLMDMSHGDLLIPTRALLNDLCENSKLMKYGNEKFTFYQAIGRCLGYFVVSIDWKYTFTEHLPALAKVLYVIGLDHHISICFTLSVFILWMIIFFVICSTPNQIERLQCKQIMNNHHHHHTQKCILPHQHSNEMIICPSGRIVILHPTCLITETIHSMLSSEHTYPRIPGTRLDDELSEESSSFELSWTEEEIDENATKNNKYPAVKREAIKLTETVEKIEPRRDVETEKLEWNGMPFYFKLFWIIQFFGWCNFAAFSLYFTSFVAIDIYGGVPDEGGIEYATNNSIKFQRFEYGVRVATAVLFFSAIIAALSGKFFIPYLNSWIGIKLVFFIGELVLNILLVLLLFQKNEIVIVGVIICFYGVAIQIHYNNVYLIIERDLRDLYKAEHQRAYVLSIFNLAILFANVVVSLFAGWIIHLFSNAFIWGIVFFAILALTGDIIVYLIFFICQRQHMTD